jgi:hypothetical protein
MRDNGILRETQKLIGENIMMLQRCASNILHLL